MFAEKAPGVTRLRTQRACFRSGEIQILDSTGNVERVIPFDDATRKL